MTITKYTIPGEQDLGETGYKVRNICYHRCPITVVLKIVHLFIRGVALLLEVPRFLFRLLTFIGKLYESFIIDFVKNYLQWLRLGKV